MSVSGVRLSALYSGWQTIGPRHAQRVGKADNLTDLPAAIVGESPVGDFAGGDYVADGGDRLFKRRRLIGHVKIPDVHIVRFKPLKAVVDFAQHPPAAEPLLMRIIPADASGLRREHPFFTVARDEAADNALGLAPAIAVRGIYEIHAGFARQFDDAFGLAFAFGVVKQHSSDAERRYLEAA